MAERLRKGAVIPACPLALNAARRWDEQRQRGLCRYYRAAGAGGLAVGVHTTQFAIRDSRIGLFRPLLEFCREEMDRADACSPEPWIRVGGICGRTHQAVAEAALLKELGYHAGLLSLASLADQSEKDLVAHCRAVAEIIPLFGFYLQPSVGGRLLPFSFWCQFAEIPAVVAIKIAPFNRYHTLDVVRAVAESGREDIALYTGNDDNILVDLLTPYRFVIGGRAVERRIVGGLLGQWAVWTRRAVEQLKMCHHLTRSAEGGAIGIPQGAGRPAGHASPMQEGGAIPQELLRLAVEVTDANAAIFDAANGFAGCIAGIHEVLRRQGLLEGTWCLDPAEALSPGQKEAIDRVCRAYPHLQDDTFVRDHLDEWLS